MAIKTQLRLSQITGSFGTGAGAINDSLSAVGTGSIAAIDLTGSLSHMASAIKRIHGADSLSDNAAGTFYATLKSNANGAVDIGSDTDGDKFGTLFLANQNGVKIGNAEEHTIMDEASGGLHIDSSEAISINSSGGVINIGNDGVAQNMNIGTGAGARVITVGNVTGASQIVLNSGTGGIQLASTGAGDVTIDSDDTLLLDSDGVLELNSSAGAISIGNDNVAQAINIGGSGGRTITVGNNSATLNLNGRGATLLIDGTGQTVDVDSAAFDLDATGEVTVDTSAGITIQSTENAADSIRLNANHANGGIDLMANNNTVVSVDANSVDIAQITNIDATTASTSTSTGALVVDGGVGIAGDLNIGGALETATFVVGDLIVTGSTTLLTSSNMVIQDNIIGLNTSGSEGYGASALDRGIVFGGGALIDKQQALYFDGSASKFIFAQGTTSPSSSSFAASPVQGDLSTICVSEVQFAFDGNDTIVSDGTNMNATTSGILTLQGDGTTDGSDGAGAVLLKADSGGIGLAFADNKGLWAEGGRFMFVSNENDQNAIKLHADAGADQKIVLLNDEGSTDGADQAGAILLDATSGGIGLHAANTKTIYGEGGKVQFIAEQNAASAILLHADAGVAQTIKIVNDEGNTTTAVDIDATAGGIKLNAGMDNVAAIHLDSASGVTIAGGDQNDSVYIENSPLRLEQITAPTTTTDKLYNEGGTLKFNGNALLTGLSEELNSAKKQVQTITGSHLALAELSGFADSDFAHVNSTDASDMVDVFVNGSLLSSGSSAYPTYNGNSGDYVINVNAMNALVVKFAFQLESDDVVIVTAHA